MTDSTTLTLEEIDPSGQIMETLTEANETGETRGSFLKKFAVGASGIAIAGALASPAAALAGGKDAADDLSIKQDIAILNYALTLEYLEQSYYAQAVSAKKLNKVNANFAKVVLAHETAHVKAITATIKQLGGTPVSRPKFNFKGTNASDKAFQKTSLALEETGVAAYIGQVTRVGNSGVLVAAAKIATVEARHAAWMRAIVGLNPAPKAFDGARSINGTLAVVKGTGFLAG